MMVNEKYKMVASHIDSGMKIKIQNFENIDFGKLIPRDKVMQQEDNRLTLVNKGGIVPANDNHWGKALLAT